MPLLIGLDIGTTTIKACLYDCTAGQIVDVAARPTPVDHPRAGWSQHDPQALWETAAACLKHIAAHAERSDIAALGISSLAEAGLPLDSTGQALYPIIAWHDRRNLAQVAWWEQHISVTDLHAITGQRVSTSFGVNKWMWIRDNHPEIAARMRRWLSAPDYIQARLTGDLASAGEHTLTDRSIASRTLLLDQRTLDWSGPLLEMAGLDKERLPAVRPGGTVAGKLSAAAAAETGLPAGLPVVLGGHDHLCAALAAGAYRPGVVVDSTGTAAALLMVLPEFFTGEAFARQSFACYTHVAPGQYALKGGLKAAGGSIEWLARQLSGGADAPLPYAELEAEAWAGVGKRAGPAWMPHLLGAGSPETDARSRGALVGLQAAHDRGDLFRGLLEALAYWLRLNLAEMERLTGQKADRILLLGGVTRLKLLSQLKADAVRLPVEVLSLPEAAATGAALLAGAGAGVFPGLPEAVQSVSAERETFLPDAQRADWYERLFDQVYAPLYETLKDLNHTLDGFS